MHVLPGSCRLHGSPSRKQSSSVVSQFAPKWVGCWVAGLTAHVHEYVPSVSDKSTHVPAFWHGLEEHPATLAGGGGATLPAQLLDWQDTGHSAASVCPTGRGGASWFVTAVITAGAHVSHVPMLAVAA